MAGAVEMAVEAARATIRAAETPPWAAGVMGCTGARGNERPPALLAAHGAPPRANVRRALAAVAGALMERGPGVGAAERCAGPRRQRAAPMEPPGEGEGWAGA